jgi:hypothetical protein
MVIVPAPVIGLPETENSAGTATATLVTVPLPPVTAEMTPPLTVMVEPSGLTSPRTEVVAVGGAGAVITPEPFIVIVVPSGLTRPRTEVVAVGGAEGATAEMTPDPLIVIVVLSGTTVPATEDVAKLGTQLPVEFV